MTALELEIQKLRRENAALKKALEKSCKQHPAAIAEIAFLRRQIDFLMECVGGEGNA